MSSPLIDGKDPENLLLDGDDLSYRCNSSIAGVMSVLLQDNVTLSEGEDIITLFVTDGKETANRSTIIYVVGRPSPPANQPSVANIRFSASGDKYYIRYVGHFSHQRCPITPWLSTLRLVIMFHVLFHVYENHLL